MELYLQAQIFLIRQRQMLNAIDKILANYSLQIQIVFATRSDTKAVESQPQGASGIEFCLIQHSSASQLNLVVFIM